MTIPQKLLERPSGEARPSAGESIAGATSVSLLVRPELRERVIDVPLPPPRRVFEVYRGAIAIGSTAAAVGAYYITLSVDLPAGVLAFFLVGAGAHVHELHVATDDGVAFGHEMDVGAPARLALEQPVAQPVHARERHLQQVAQHLRLGVHARDGRGVVGRGAADHEGGGRRIHLLRLLQAIVPPVRARGRARHRQCPPPWSTATPPPSSPTA